MNDIVKIIIRKYNGMSEKKMCSKAYLEGYRQCVVDIQEELINQGVKEPNS